MFRTSYLGLHKEVLVHTEYYIHNYCKAFFRQHRFNLRKLPYRILLAVSSCYVYEYAYS